MESRQSAGSEPLVALRHVARVYRDGGVRALDGVSLEIPERQFVSIVGPSGCGKSTLLHVMGALDVPTAGEVLFRGVPRRKGAGRWPSCRPARPSATRRLSAGTAWC
ncbi:MAG: ATP-binding cassette domain-containing protein, partial [Planctomycetia bacterium]